MHHGSKRKYDSLHEAFHDYRLPRLASANRAYDRDPNPFVPPDHKNEANDRDITAAANAFREGLLTFHRAQFDRFKRQKYAVEAKIKYLSAYQNFLKYRDAVDEVGGGGVSGISRSVSSPPPVSNAEVEQEIQRFRGIERHIDQHSDNLQQLFQELLDNTDETVDAVQSSVLDTGSIAFDTSTLPSGILPEPLQNVVNKWGAFAKRFNEFTTEFTAGLGKITQAYKTMAGDIAKDCADALISKASLEEREAVYKVFINATKEQSELEKKMMEKDLAELSAEIDRIRELMGNISDIDNMEGDDPLPFAPDAAAEDRLLMNELTESMGEKLAVMLRPSYRYRILADMSRAERWSNFEFSIFAPFEGAYIAIDYAMDMAKVGVRRLIEVLFGDSTAIAAGMLYDGIIEGIAAVQGFAASPEIMALLLAVDTAYFAIKDGLCFKMFSDWFAQFGLDLMDVLPPWALVPRYPQLSHLGHASFSEIRTSKKDKVAAAQKVFEAADRMDDITRAINVDFWGSTLVNSLKAAHPTMKDYQPMKPYKTQYVVPGLYIDPHDHPYESDMTLQACQELERRADESDLISTTMDDQLYIANYVKPKKGLVRNFLAFPSAKSGVEWPDPYSGQQQQTQGFFDKKDLDPFLASCFELWATKGTFGPMYNRAVSTDAQQKAAAQNVKDIQQWLNPDPDVIPPDAATILTEWLATAQGATRASQIASILNPDRFFKDEYFNETITDWKSVFEKDAPTCVWYWDKCTAEERDDYWKHVITTDYAFFHSYFDQHGRPPLFPVIRNQIQQYVKDKRGWGCYPYRLADRTRPHRFVTDLWVADAVDNSPNLAKMGQQLDQAARMVDELHLKAASLQADIDREAFQVLWREYAIESARTRTMWDYIAKYQVFFMEQLAYVAMTYSTEDKSKLYEEYLKALQGRHAPMDMDAAHRLSFMGEFAKLAYNTDPDVPITQDLEAKCNELFGAVLVNVAFVTADPATIWHLPWAKQLPRDDFVYINPKHMDAKVRHLLGDIFCRVLVLENPCTMVLAFRGTSNLVEAVYDADIHTSYIAKWDPKVNPTDFRESTVKFLEPGIDEITRPMIFRHSNPWIHHGFATAYEIFHERIAKFINDNAVAAIKVGHPIEQLQICGHSLGGALSHIAAIRVPRIPNPLHRNVYAQLIHSKGHRYAEHYVRQYAARYANVSPSDLKGQNIDQILKDQPPFLNPNIYTFCSPRVGNEHFQDLYNRHTNETIHLSTMGDPVTCVPPYLLPHEGYEGPAVETIKDIIKLLMSKDPSMAVAHEILDSALESFNFPTEIPQAMIDWYKEAGVKNVLMNIILTYAGNKKEMVYRGPGVFMTVNYDETVQPYEYNTDKSTLVNVYRMFVKNRPPGVSTVELGLALHGIDKNLERFNKFLGRDTDFFRQFTKDQLPAWARHGSIGPDPTPPPDPSPGDKGDLPDAVLKAMADPRNILGTIRHTPSPQKDRNWYVVSKDQVDLATFHPDVLNTDRIDQAANKYAKWLFDKRYPDPAANFRTTHNSYYYT